VPESHPLFADVLLPLPVGGAFTYRVPDELAERVTEGVRVVVQFGARKIYTALVTRYMANRRSWAGPKRSFPSLMNCLSSPAFSGSCGIGWHRITSAIPER